MNVYKKIYKIKVRETDDKRRWYYSKSNRLFDASLLKLNKRTYFKIDDIHKIPTEFAELICIERVRLYY